MKKNVLIAVSEFEELKDIKSILENLGFEVDAAEDGKDARDKILNINYDFVIYDMEMQDLDGIKFCTKTREFSTCPIIILGSDDSIELEVLSLDNGADDYLIKPVDKTVLRARMKAILRRADPNKNFFEKSVLEIENMRINTLGRIVSIGDKEVSLTAKEFDLLMLLAMHRGKIYSRNRLLEEIWCYEHYADVRTVDVHIRRLREKVEVDPSRPSFIMTKWGSGYYFKSDNELARNSELLDL